MNRTAVFLVVGVLALAAFCCALGLTKAKASQPQPVAAAGLRQTKSAGPIRNLIWRIIHRDEPQPEPEPEPTPEPEPPVPPVPPVPPPPPPPQTGLRVLITGPNPRALRELEPGPAALVTSRVFRDFTDAACETTDGLPGLRVYARSAPMPAEWDELAKAAPENACALVATIATREKLVLAPLPDTATALAKLSEYAGVQSPGSVALPGARSAPAFSHRQWEQFTSATKVVIFDGQKRFLSAKPRDKVRHPYGKAPGTVSLAEAGVRVIPRSEWPKWIAARKAANAGLLPLLHGKLACSDQDGTNYCWANGPCNAGATILYVTGQGTYLLSAASVAGPLTGYRNVGGWPVDAIRFMASHGAVRDSLWPNDALSSRYASLPEVKADYPRHLVLGTIADLGASGDIFAETVTCVLLGCPVVVCYDWWGHCVLAVDVALEGGVWYLVCRNSWGMTFGDQGFFKLPEGRGPNRGTPDDAQVVLLLRQLPPTATSAIGSEGASLRPLRKTEVPESAEVSGGCADGSCPAGSRPSWTVGGYRRGHAKPKLDRPSPLPGLPRSL